MSEIVGDYSNTEEKIHKQNCKRNVSGELDVFEATRYFSDFNEPTPEITTEYSRIQIQKQTNILAEHRQNKVHPETEEKLREPRGVVVVKSEEKEMTRGGSGKKLASFLNSLLRSAGLKKSKIKSTLEVETPRGERKRRNSCVLVTTHTSDASPISSVDALRLNSRRRSFDVKDVKDSKKSDNVKLCESLSLGQKVQRKYRNADGDVNDGCESDSSSESDLFELDLFVR